MGEPTDAEDEASVITCNLEGLIERYAAGAQSIFQWTADEVEGKQSVALFHVPANVSTLVPRLLKTAVDAGKFQEEVTLVRKDGSQFQGLLTVRPMMKEGKHIGYMGYTKPL